MASKKYYWLKLQKDFFKRHDIRIVESMPNGKDYILFYLKMLVESISHEGELRFSDTIPYNEEMLSTITNTNIDIVRAAMQIFKELNLIEILEDSTIFMAETQKMLGFETEWAEKKRIYRQKRTMSLECPADVRQEKELEIEKDKELEIEKDKEKKSKSKTYYPTDDEMDALFKDFIKMRRVIKAPMSDKAIELAMSKLERLSSGDRDTAIAILEQSIENSWKGLYEIKAEKKQESRAIDWENL